MPNLGRTVNYNDEENQLREAHSLLGHGGISL